MVWFEEIISLIDFTKMDVKTSCINFLLINKNATKYQDTDVFPWLET